MRRSSVGRWSSWYGLVARGSNWRRSSSHRRKQSATGLRRPIVTSRREDGLTTVEREELSRLRRENRQLKLERDILSKAAAWFARETDVIPPKGSNS
jgi:transposase-like protein